VVAGVDEVGRGSWAGPLTVGAVVANPATRIYKVRDSKVLSAPQRELLHGRITSWAVASAVGHASVAECTDLGMAQAQRLAARRAIDGLGIAVEHVLVDGSWDFISTQEGTTGTDSGTTSADRADYTLIGTGERPASSPLSSPTGSASVDERARSDPQVTRIVRGDAKSLSIAAASIIAKVERDRIMIAAADDYPGYWFASNKGYPCPRHVASLAAWGPCAIHRRRWVFMDDLRWSGVGRITSPLGHDQLRLFDIEPDL